MSPRGQQRIVYSQPGSPPEVGSPKQTPPRPVTPQESSNRPEIVTPSWNTPTKAPPPQNGTIISQGPPVKMPGTVISQGPQVNMQGIPMNGVTLNQSVNGRPVIYQQVPPNGRPVSHQSIPKGNGVIYQPQQVNIAPAHHVAGEVTPPQPITPLYAQPQPHRVISSGNIPESQQRYKPFDNIGGKNLTFGPSQPNWIPDNKQT